MPLATMSTTLSFEEIFLVSMPVAQPDWAFNGLAFRTGIKEEPLISQSSGARTATNAMLFQAIRKQAYFSKVAAHR